MRSRSSRGRDRIVDLCTSPTLRSSVAVWRSASKVSSKNDQGGNGGLISIEVLSSLRVSYGGRRLEVLIKNSVPNQALSIVPAYSCH